MPSVLRSQFFGPEGRPCIAWGEPRFAADPGYTVGGKSAGESSTAIHTGIRRARNNPGRISQARGSARIVAASERGGWQLVLGLGR